MCVALSEVPVSDYEDVCLVRGDQGRAIRALLDRVANEWALLSIATLSTQRLGFTELQQRIAGIPRRMLTLTLRKLERDGLVIRTAHAEVPARVEYEPSELAASLNNVWTGSAGPLVTSPSEAP